MTYDAAHQAEIRRLYYAEHWRVGTIATQLALHPDVVRRVLGLKEPAPPKASPRVLPITPFLPFLQETLQHYPRLRATRLYDMLEARGYPGSVRTLREYVAELRPRPKREAFLRLDPLVGEQAQVDWAHVGSLSVEGGQRALWAFVMVLAYSRAMWAELVFDLTVSSLCRSLVRASSFFGGCTRQWLFDNPKTVVLERSGDAVRFHPTLLELCGHLRVQPRLCTPRQPQQKGRVERAIRYLKERFFAGRTLYSREQGNQALLTFLAQIASQRPHPSLPERSVAQVFLEEQARLLTLPEVLPPTDLVLPVAVDKTAFVRFDTNLYSVPSAYAQGRLTLVADDQHVRLLSGETCVARHPRSFGRRQTSEHFEHRQELLQQKKAARALKGKDRLRAQIPGMDTLLARWVEAGRNLGAMVARTLKLLELYGEALLTEAVADLVTRGLHDPGALAVCCEKRRREKHLPVPVSISLPPHLQDRDVIPHNLEDYDGKR